MLWKSLVILNISVLLGLVLVGCDGFTGSKTVKVAVGLPLGLEIGEDMLHGVELALAEAEGKAGEVTVELVTFDTSDPEGSPVSPDLERDAAEKATADETIVAYVGAATSDQARASMAVLNEASIAQLSPSATWPGLTKPGFGPGEPGVYYPTGRRHFFRVVPSDEVQGEVAARWADKLGFGKVYVVDDGTAYGQGIAGIFEVNAQDLGLDIVGQGSFDGGSATPEDLAEISAGVVEAEPDMVFLGSSFGNGGANFVNALRELDKDIALMMPDGMAQDEFIAEVGADQVEGIYATNVTIPADRLQTADATAFLATFQSAYDKEPPAYAVSSYEAMKVLLRAIEQAENPTRNDVLAALADLGEVSGVFGEWHFDAQGDISATTISGLQVQDGAWEFVQTIQ